MKSRYTFNASGGSVLVSPNEYVLEVLSGSLRLLRPSGLVHLANLTVILAVAFGYLGSFVLLVSSSFYQSARPWESALLLWTALGAFFIGFFVLLFATAKWAPEFAMRSVGRRSSHAVPVVLRAWEAGKLIQKVLLQTADHRILAIEVEATQDRFKEALRLANVALPTVPLLEEERLSIESARQRVVRESPEPRGPGRVNVPGLAILASFIVLNLLYLWLLGGANIVLGAFGLVAFGPLTVWLAWYVPTRTGRFVCGVCNRLTVFRRRGEKWTCVQCGNSWHRSLTMLQTHE
jgi:hypothetical protein